MSFYVYILKCNDGSYDTGHTDNIENRLSEHYSAININYTAKLLLVTLVFMQDFASRSEALAAEISIKKWTRKKKEALIAENWNLLKKLSSRRSGS